MALKGGAVVPINRQKPEAQSELPAGYPAGGGKALFTDPSLAPARPKKASMTNCRGQEEFFKSIVKLFWASAKSVWVLGGSHPL